MQNRKSTYTLPGGDTVQMEKTAQGLRKRGIIVDISLELEPDVSKYDIVHLFNFTRIQETYMQLKNAKKHNKKVALSTIYWNNYEYEKKVFKGARKFLTKTLGVENVERLKGLNRIFRDREVNTASLRLLIKGRKKMQEYVLKNVDYFLPNAYSEIELLNFDFNKSFKNYSVIPNGVDSKIFGKTTDTKKFDKYKDCILCVARFDPRKNHINLLKALKYLDIPVVFVGSASKSHSSYFEQIKNIAKHNKVIILDSLDHNELCKLYSLCKVHILPSWFETPGLSSLEAGACGANLVVSNKGTTYEYFKDMVSYCDPNSIDSIIESVICEYNKPKKDILKNYILSNYTWDIAAERTLEAYKKILKK